MQVLLSPWFRRLWTTGTGSIILRRRIVAPSDHRAKAPAVTDLALMELHTAALYRHDASGRILTTNEPDGSRAPRLFLGRTTAGNVWRFRDDLPPDLVQRLGTILAAEPIATDLRQPPVGLAALRDLLGDHAPIDATWQGPAWSFPEEIAPPRHVNAFPPSPRAQLQKHFPYLTTELDDCQPCLAVVRDGAAVSVCFSSRNTDHAAEAGLHTVEAFRGRGYAVAVTAAWALAVRRSGRIPLYSTAWDNLASQAVARRLGLILYGADCSIA
jgi:RimJ/RimL family protein N-acetyltransferase